ncbi:hypothetical protein XF35_38525 [Streptomyces platensis subsp. clarensis]|uniref:Uncharacterized protein n=1 Tax=Streptomyces showdoensis TaxID=68268 RepID=A0A2P2GMK9_STREW|nr:hypothetical protein VO63_20125 [Streptomyces showdoensis]MCW7990974.1 hypothetical protein [Streptomyces platensis subsp. clarensis]
MLRREDHTGVERGPHHDYPHHAMSSPAGQSSAAADLTLPESRRQLLKLSSLTGAASPTKTAEARQFALAILAASDRADHQAAGIPRLEDRRDERTRERERSDDVATS